MAHPSMTNQRPFQEDNRSRKRQKIGSNCSHTSQFNTYSESGITIIPPTTEHKHTVIFLHDHGTTPAAFATAFFENSESTGQSLETTFPNIKWIFPPSVLRDTTPSGTSMPSWFVYWSLAEPEHPAQADAQRNEMSQNLGPLLDLVDNEVDAVGGDHVCLTGMGQGCAMASIAFLTGWHDIGCFVGLAGWLPCQAHMEDIIANSTTHPEAQTRMRAFVPSGRAGMPHWLGALGRPVLLLHCRDDAIVPAARSEGLCRVLQDMGMVVQCRGYEVGGHEGVTESHAMSEFVRFLDHWIIESRL
ncbi:Alpha/Beta hydrolase protein [Phyllosticta citrichinensis]